MMMPWGKKNSQKRMKAEIAKEAVDREIKIYSVVVWRWSFLES